MFGIKWGGCGRSKNNRKDEGFSVKTRTGALEDGTRRLALRFYGQVQGVGFRWTSQVCAQKVGCTGWVRNESDGSVTMELQGTDAQISNWFGAFAKSYERFPLDYRIAQKDDIEPVEGDDSFTMRN